MQTDPQPGPGEALVRVAAAGVNFLDVRLLREGSSEPLGFEGAGVIAAIGGDGAPGLREGQRVAWAMHAGSYAKLAVVPTRLLVPLPDDVSYETAAALMLQGLTADYLTRDCHRVSAGETVLVHAAAGGVGRLVTQLAVAAGARVLGTVSSDEKAAVAREAGADAAIRYDRDDFAAVARELTGGEGVHCVFDGVNLATFWGSLRSLRPRGTLVLFGQSSGQIEPIAPKELRRHGSVKLTYPGLEHFIADREELLERSRRLFDALADGVLTLKVTSYPLTDASRAHAELEGRRTTGKLVLVAEEAA